MDNEQDDEMTPKWHYVLPGQTHQNRWKAGEVVELLPGQAANWVDVTISKGYATEHGARNAAERNATVADAPKKVSAPKESAKEVTDVKQ
jgi:hypothetical protein